jgi:hypothetical protein
LECRSFRLTNCVFKLATEASKSGKNPLRTKKLYVLAALEVERYHQLSKAQRNGGDTVCFVKFSRVRNRHLTFYFIGDLCPGRSTH